MAAISATAVKELREETNISMMECKKALEEANGDKAAAIKLLRERGMAIAGKKASREAKEGLVVAATRPDGSAGALAEINCETDFVARNEIFKAFAADLAKRALETDAALADGVKDIVAQKIAEIGENIIVRRNMRFVRSGPGAVASYIHLGSSIGVLVEVGCEKDATTAHATFPELVKDITLHIAACSPRYLASGDVPADVIASEKEIYAKQVVGKPAQIVDKIVEGKLKKFFTEVCLVDQNFVKDPELTITKLLEAKSKEVGDKLGIRRFARFQRGT